LFTSTEELILSYEPMVDRPGLNLIMPGNPRYQPKSLIPYFGYDLNYSYVARVEIANLLALRKIGVIPLKEMRTLTGDRVRDLLGITTTEVDQVERKFTKHDIRAWVRIAQQKLDSPLGRWLHVPLTSYDALDTARILQFSSSYYGVVAPSIVGASMMLVKLVRRFANQIMIARTHGKAALPITVGFWLATILSRMMCTYRNMDRYAAELPGKITGAVGARNAQYGVGIMDRCGGRQYGEIVLEYLGLPHAGITTQILPPEPLANYLFQCVLFSGALGQLGRDGRNLMRTEIAEIQEAREEGQVGSSTMAGKQNPIWFENEEGTWWKQVAEFVKVFFTIISEHQRDLVGSCIMRDFPTIVVNMVSQLDILLRTNSTGVPFISRLQVNAANCQRNFEQVAGSILGEPLYVALQMAGYADDAHKLVNDILAPKARESGRSLIVELQAYAEEDETTAQALGRIPDKVIALFHNPERYIGDAEAQAHAIADMAEELCQQRAS